MRRPSPTAVATTVFAAGFVALTWLVFRTSALAPLDGISRDNGLHLDTAWGQVTAAMSFTFYPYVFYAVLLGLAAWAWRLRLRNLAWALLLTPLLAGVSVHLMKDAFARPRPPDVVDIVTSSGYAYPSGHMTAVTAFAVMLTATLLVMRRPWIEQVVGRTAGAVLVAYVAYNRWALRAHWPTDILAGMLWGALAASFSLLLFRVQLGHLWTLSRRQAGGSSLAVIANPTKIPDWTVFRAQVEGAAREHGWTPPLWLETTIEDDGQDAARLAVARGASLVIAAGGDGTVRAVAESLAGSESRFAIVPAGTGNLLARNLGVPLDFTDALAVALTGEAHQIDVLQVVADDGEPQVSLVMAGMGADAIVMAEANPDLKRVVGPAAYVVSAVSAAQRPSFAITVSVDDRPPAARVLDLALIANVGDLQAGVRIAPDARADDGLFDLVLARADSAAEWVNLAGAVVLGSSNIRGIERGRGRRVVLETPEPTPYQLDGDNPGTCRRLEAVVLPGALSIVLPRG